MRRISKTAAGILLVGLGFSLSTDVQAAPAPEVYSIIEGRDTQTDQATLVLIGKRVTKYVTWELRLPDGTSAGTPQRAYKSRSMLVFRLPQDLDAGPYDLVLTHGKRSPITETHRIELTNGGLLPGALVQSHLAQSLVAELSDAETLGGFQPDYFTDASSIDTGVLSTDRFSAWDDLQIESRVGDGPGQLSEGHHAHDGDYARRSELEGPRTFNDAGNPVDWTALKSVPTGILDGTGHDHDTSYFRKTELNDPGTVNDPSNPVDWTKLKGIPSDLADGDADTTYTAGTGLALNAGAFSVSGVPWTSLAGVPADIADGDDDTAYTAGTGLVLTGTQFAVSGVPWTSLAAVPADIADGDDDTTYSAGKNVTIAGGAIDVPSLPWTDLTGVPSGLDDGDDDTTYKPGAHVTLTGNVFSVDSFPWTRLTSIPPDIADGDDDTTYTAGTGLALTGTVFSVSGVTWTSLAGVPAGFADGIDDGSHWSESGGNVYRSDGHVGIGTTGPAADLHVDGYDGVLFGGRMNAGTIPATGAGMRFMWYPKKAAFRAGRVGLVASNAADWDDKAVGQYSVALGVDTKASGLSSTALGSNTTASDEASTAMGSSAIASGLASTAMGFGATASGDTSTAMGSGATASGNTSTAMGRSTTASEFCSTAMGWSTTASGGMSTAMGYSTTAQAYASLAIGRYNTASGSSTLWNSSDPVFVVGNGTSDASRSNAFTLLKNGDLTIAGTLTENSDARLKKDVTALGGVLGKIAGIRGVTYQFKDEDAGPAGTHVGLLAQEVRDAFPELVSEDGDGTLSVAYGKFTAVLLEAVKEQQKEIEARDRVVAKLRERLDRIEEGLR